jgi:dihydropyrimidinase
MLDLLISGCSIAGPDGDLMATDIGIKGGSIVSLGERIQEEAASVVKAVGCVVLPGIVDLHTHMRSPAGEASLFREETAAAVAGGVTTIGDFAYPPGTRFELDLQRKRERLQAEALCDFVLHTVVRSRDQVQRAATRTVKVFLASSGLGTQCEEGLETVPSALEKGCLVLAHVEAMSDYVAIARYVADRPDLPGKIHILHVPHQRYSMVVHALAGERITLETGPHYLLWEWTWNQPGCDVNPPVVPANLWPEITAGRIHTIGTDHCSYTWAEKQQHGLPGFPGLETTLRLVFTYGVEAGRISWTEMIQLLCAGPARVLDLYPRKGAIQVGSDADLVLFDPRPSERLATLSHGRGDFSPFLGLWLRGRVMRTWVRGRQVYGDGVVAYDAAGWGTWQEPLPGGAGSARDGSPWQSGKG